MEYICNDCPRRCGARRDDRSGGGVCASPSLPRVIRAAPHFGEEPCISGSRGSGTVFFSGCNLRCVFCQNYEISTGGFGKELSVSGLRDIFLRLRDRGVHNLNLVTGSHFVRQIAEALDGLTLRIPVVWNSSGYDSVSSLRLLDGLVQVYMPDLKYLSAPLAAKYSAAPDYPDVARAALDEMFRQVGLFRLDGEGLLTRGMLVRHLVLPGALDNSFDVIDYVAERFPGDRVLFSLMSQFTPTAHCPPELSRTLNAEEYARISSYLTLSGIENGFFQELEAAGTELIPDFDLTGV